MKPNIYYLEKNVDGNYDNIIFLLSYTIDNTPLEKKYCVSIFAGS
jgi:hypothetical protein